MEVKGKDSMKGQRGEQIVLRVSNNKTLLGGNISEKESCLVISGDVNYF